MSDDVVEQVLAFECDGARLWGILASPGGEQRADVAVLIVVGGPQYRVGSHRQFVLLARALAAAGFPALRFDYTGMGDSDGPRRSFDSAGPDLRAALDELSRACPGRRIVVWGLCDAASAALMFAADDPRVAGVVAANPWARSEATLAATQVRHYYGARLLQPDFWSKLFGGGIDWRGSLRALARALHATRARAPTSERGTFQEAMARGVARLRGRLLLVLSGNDLTAREFLEYARTSPAWAGLLDESAVARVDLADADHTFSRRAWLDAVAAETIAWLERLAPCADAAHPRTTRGIP